MEPYFAQNPSLTPLHGNMAATRGQKRGVEGAKVKKVKVFCSGVGQNEVNLVKTGRRKIGKR